MVVRRSAVVFCTALVALAAPLTSTATAAPAKPAVGIHNLPRSFEVGGSPGPLSIVVTRRDRGCVLVRRSLTVRLKALTQDQVRVERAVGGGWQQMRLTSVGSGAWRAADPAPDPIPLCRGDLSVGHYRVTFLAGAPTGRAEFVAQAFAGLGRPLGRAGAARSVRAGEGAAEPVPPPTKPGATPTPRAESTSASPTAKAPPPAAAVGGPSPEAVAGPAGPQESGGVGLIGLVIGLGLAMVAVGAALLIFLLRRRRDDAREAGTDAGAQDGTTQLDPDPTVTLPTLRG